MEEGTFGPGPVLHSHRCNVMPLWGENLNSGLRVTYIPASNAAGNYIQQQQRQQHPFNSPLSGSTQVSRYHKATTNLDLTEARDSEWQWHHLDHMQVCTSPQADTHTSSPPLIFTGLMPFLPPNQQCQSTQGM